MINPYSEEIVLGVIEEIGYVLCLQNFGFLWKFLYFWGVFLRIFLNVLIEFLIRLLSTNMADMPFSHLNLWWAWLNHCCIDDQSIDIHSIGLGFNSRLRQADYTNNKWKYKKVVVLPIRIVKSNVSSVGPSPDFTIRICTVQQPSTFVSLHCPRKTLRLFYMSNTRFVLRETVLKKRKRLVYCRYTESEGPFAKGLRSSFLA